LNDRDGTTAPVRDSVALCAPAQKGKGRSETVSRSPTHRSSEHGPGWSASVGGHDHQRPQDSINVPSYNVTSGTDQVEALKKTSAHLADLTKSHTG
jgi:hypothetical protein